MSVIILGDIMLDKYIDGNVTRISPEAPVPVVHVQKVYNNAGGCGNVSKSIAALGVANQIVAVIGNDIHGAELKELLKHKLIKPTLITHNQPTTTKVRVVSNKHQLLRYDIESNTQPDIEIETLIKKSISKSKATVGIISDYGKGVCTDGLCKHFIQTLLNRNIEVLVDPKCSDWNKYQGCFLISPNFKEFCEAIGTTIANEDAIIESHAKQLMKHYNITNILVTRSAKGMSLITNKSALHIPTIANEVYDVTGAGDTVIATIGAMLSQGKTLKEAVLLSNKAAAIAVAHFGTYAVTMEELLGK